jgi:Ca2+-binding RTX toxin-like protein
MTKVVFKQAFDISNIDLTQFVGGDVDSISASQVRLSSGLFSATVFGTGMGYNFFTDNYTGTVQGIDAAYDGGLLFSARKINVALDVLIDHKNDPEALLNDFFGGADSFTGSKFDDVLSGFGGKDTIVAGKGSDVLIGGADRDILTGGVESDSFLYLAASDSTKAAPDLITDLDNTDNINLTLLGVQGDVTSSYSAGSDITSFKIDVDGDGSAEMLIQATGNHTDFNNFLM